MSLESGLCAQYLLFDDEPIESILYDCPSNGASSANAFVDTEQVLEEIGNALCGDNMPRALEITRWLFRSDLPVSEKACVVLASMFKQLVPNYPRPVIPELVIEYQSLLDELVTLAQAFDSSILINATETICYRFYEGCGEFDRARDQIALMRDRSEKPFTTAQLINNYGYEYLLEQDFARARKYFVESLHMFEQLQDENEIANAQANLLTCEFELCTDLEKESLVPTLIHAHTRLYEDDDWRVRKTMRILAARAESQERMLVAVAWARRAVNATIAVKTHLHQDDKKNLQRLYRKLRRRRRLQMVCPQGVEKAIKTAGLSMNSTISRGSNHG
jgi:hypothetical protein